MGKRLGRGFTLVELVIVISIIGILAAIAIPRFINIREQAHNAQKDGIIGGIRAGILTTAARNQVGGPGTVSETFPPNLEATWAGMTGGTQPCPGVTCPAICNAADECFELVIPGGFENVNWIQTAAGTYTYDNPIEAGNPDWSCVYDITQVNGTFLCTAL